MGQKTHPYGFRVGITEAHRSRWYAPKALYGELLIEDFKIRRFVDHRLNRTPPFAAVSDIHIERTREELKVIIKTARPGLVIGPKGAEVDRLQEELQYMTGRKVSISILEIKHPDLDAQIVAEGMAEQLKKRASYRRVVKMRAPGVMQSGAEGVRILLGGRLGGAEMRRTLDTRLGSMPLSSLQANVEYGFAEASTKSGQIGVKVWIYKGPYAQGEEGEEHQSRAAGARPRARGRR